MAESTVAQHSPGPWHVNGLDTILCVNHSIAKVFHPEADAKLIAAAPDLLSTLIFAEKYLRAAVADGALMNCAIPVSVAHERAEAEIQAALA